MLDIQTRKLNIIEYLIGLEDEKVFEKIETIVLKLKTKKAASIRPLTNEELIARAEKSDIDYLSGRITTQEELEKESKNW